MVTANEKEMRNLRNPLRMRWVGTHIWVLHRNPALLSDAISAFALHVSCHTNENYLTIILSCNGWSEIDSVFEKNILSESIWFGRRFFLFCGFIYLLLFIMICWSWVPGAVFVLWRNRRKEKIRILLQMLIKVRKSCRDWKILLKCMAPSVELSSLEEVWAFVEENRSVLCFVWYKQSIKQIDIF